MRKIFTCCLSLLSLTMFGQASPDSDTSKTSPGKKTVSIRIRCIAVSGIAKEPIWIVDGIVVGPIIIKDINPADIDSIIILKGSEAAALFGCRATNGVVIITTRSIRERTIFVKDILSGDAIRAAKLCFVSGSDTLLLATTDIGVVKTDKLKPGKDYRVTIASVGYQTLSAYYNATNKVMHFALERNTVIDPLVINAAKNISSVFIYPNPVLPGRTVTIKTNSEAEQFIHVRMVAIDGHQLLAQKQKVYKGVNSLLIDIDSRWADGIYFIQLSDESKKMIRQEKILIQ